MKLVTSQQQIINNTLQQINQAWYRQLRSRLLVKSNEQVTLAATNDIIVRLKQFLTEIQTSKATSSEDYYNCYQMLNQRNAMRNILNTNISNYKTARPKQFQQLTTPTLQLFPYTETVNYIQAWSALLEAVHRNYDKVKFENNYDAPEQNPTLQPLLTAKTDFLNAIMPAYAEIDESIAVTQFKAKYNPNNTGIKSRSSKLLTYTLKVTELNQDWNLTRFITIANQYADLINHYVGDLPKWRQISNYAFDVLRDYLKILINRGTDKYNDAMHKQLNNLINQVNALVFSSLNFTLTVTAFLDTVLFQACSIINNQLFTTN